jgi:hypothetical protein
MNYRVGDVVKYRTFGGQLRRVRVTRKEADVKNGEPGFDGKLLDTIERGALVKASAWHEEVWGYDRQIVEVEGKEEEEEHPETDEHLAGCVWCMREHDKGLPDA